MYCIPLLTKPDSCLSCPCLETLTAIPSETSATFSGRFCRATGQTIMIYPEFDATNVPDNWFNFSIPDSCPIQFVDFN
jgi:hypothetical protein